MWYSQAECVVCLTPEFLTGTLNFEEATVTGASYLNILKNYAIIHTTRGWIFQQDEAPPHLCQPSENVSRPAVSRQMDWGRESNHMASQVTRLAHASDFFLWAYIKNFMYQMKVQHMEKLNHQIATACETVIPVMLQNTW
jgi:hypothetical protein